ncbi:MAG TPA: dihydroneopterin aldolase, partial [Chloroflexota bacterium]|nr:dihydroneopterin aldolase [Chloroflexota bacterium]
RIVLRNLSFYGYHGCDPGERQLGQRFLVDLALTLDLEPAGRSDDLTRTVDYGVVFRLVREIVEGEPCFLIETVAERIASALLEKTIVRSVWVAVRKPRAPIKGMANGEVAVEITRSAG